MEIILAIAVASAVIFFGALISIGNERQRKAIDELREVAIHWAVQDLKIKKENLSSTIKIDDPSNWIINIIRRVCGHNFSLQIIESFENPQAISLSNQDKSITVIISPLSLKRLRIIKNQRNNPLINSSNNNPLLYLPKDTKVFEANTLNCGINFESELSIVWEKITTQKIQHDGNAWIYLIPRK